MNYFAEICVVRHGETDWNVQGILQGSLDVPLNDNGRRQAGELAAHFAPYGFAGIYSSPLSRARETAEIICRDLGHPEPSCHRGIRERYFGSVQGVPKAELSLSHPELCQKILERDPTAQFLDGEALDDFADRVIDAVLDIALAHQGERALLVTHGWVMDVITRHIFGVPRTTILPMKRKNGEAVWLAAGAGAFREIPAPTP